MPKAPNPVLRAAVPLLVILLGIGVVVAIFVNSRQSATTTPASTPVVAGTAPSSGPAALPATGGQGGASTQASEAVSPTLAATGQTGEAAKPSESSPAEVPTLTATAPQAPAGSAPQQLDTSQWRAQVFAGDPAAADFEPLGSLTGEGSSAQIAFSNVGAGLQRITLANHYVTVDKKDRIEVQAEATLGAQVLTPLAALGIEVAPIAEPGAPPPPSTFISLARGVPGGPVWRKVDGAPAGTFEAFIVDAEGRTRLRIGRQYVQRANSYVFEVRQHVDNVSGSPVTIRWYQNGPIDIAEFSSGYGGDKRRIRFGHLVSPALDPSRTRVVSDDYLIPHADALGSRNDAGFYKPSAVRWPLSEDDRRTFAMPLWPNTRAIEGQFTMSWTAIIGRYFGVAIAPLIPADQSNIAPVLAPFEIVGRAILDRGSGSEVVALTLTSPLVALQPGARADLSHAVYAGPLAKPEITKDPLAARVGLQELVVYNFGGMCGFLTFEPVTHALLGLLRFLHDNLFSDWSLSIIMLVVIVRTCLHPVTRWSQIRMQRMGKQMQNVAPKQQKLQERYRDDPAKLREETAKLWREEGVSPAGFLGCLPMFLQMPIWIALYATLYFAQELRQEPAFYGLFQFITNHHWHFLADLSESDNFLPLGFQFSIPLVGTISSINVLPLVLGVVFFIHQKYLTPPTATQLTPEQEMQQKIVKWMSVIMFPVFMYNAPSGLTLYFATNSTFAIFENKWIRAHINKHDLLNPETFKKKPKPGGKPSSGFMARLQAEAERRMKEAEARKKAQARR